jgi:uncharacterized membrane protein YuzA (DUF378 family)
VEFNNSLTGNSYISFNRKEVKQNNIFVSESSQFIRQKEVVYMIKMNALEWLALILLIIGGLNWGLFGILNFDVVAKIFGQMSAISRIIYSLVGIAAIYAVIFSLKPAQRE